VSQFSDPYDWSLLVGYLSDANLPMTAQVFIGPDPAPFGALSYPMWTSATATISATLPDGKRCADCVSAADSMGGIRRQNSGASIRISFSA